jgi:peroxiredoxin
MSASPKRRNAELMAIAITAVIAAPFIAMFAATVADAEVRRQEAPLRALIGDSAFDQAMRGTKTEQHYAGNSLLAPDFSLPDRHGKQWKLRAHRGKVVLMNFWTITCAPCLEEMPSLIRLARQAAGRDDVEVVTVTTDKTWEEIAAVVPEGSKLTVLFDPDKRVVRDQFGSKMFPETWLIDARGVVRLRVDGPREWDSPLAWDAIEALL